MENRNLACRIFKEQIDLVMQLPRKEAAEVLYQAILSSLNQIENQNENAYVSDSDSVSVSVSVLGRMILKLLEKNIVWKEFSNNYGGRRPGAGKKKQPEPEEKSVEEIIQKTAQGFKMRPMKTIQVTQDLVFPPDQFFDAYRQQLPDATARAEQWLRRSNMVGKTITLQKIGEIIQKFEKNKKQKNT